MIMIMMCSAPESCGELVLEYTLRGRWRPACVLKLASLAGRRIQDFGSGGGGPILDQLELEFIAVFEKLSDSCLK